MALDPKTGQPIYGGSPGVGLRNVGSYQVSGAPFVTQSLSLDSAKMHMVEFPNVTKRVVVTNLGTVANKFVLVMFNSGSTTTEITFPGSSGAQTFATSADVYANFHYVPVAAGASFDINAKVKRIYVANLTADSRWGGASTNGLGYMVTAELTNVPTARMYELTGSGITE